VLSLAKRLLAKNRDTPLADHLLRVATVHITEHLRDKHQRVLEICFAFDALGADLPAFVRHEIALEDEAQVRTYLDAIAPLPEIYPPPPDTSPVRGLLRTTINAILYATSASVTPERWWRRWDNRPDGIRRLRRRYLSALRARFAKIASSCNTIQSDLERRSPSAAS
jgi:hypothetical protein